MKQYHRLLYSWQDPRHAQLCILQFFVHLEKKFSDTKLFETA